MKRLTKEREREIRGIRATDREKCHWGHVGDLLEEIDALRFHNERNLENARRSCNLMALTIEQLQIDNAKLAEALDVWLKIAVEQNTKLKNSLTQD